MTNPEHLPMPAVRTTVRHECSDVVAITCDWKDELGRAAAGVAVYTADGTQLCAFGTRDLGVTSKVRTAIRFVAVRLALDLAETCRASVVEVRVPSRWMAEQLSDAEATSKYSEIGPVREAQDRFESVSFVAVPPEVLIPVRDLALAASQRRALLPTPPPVLAGVSVRTTDATVEPRKPVDSLVEQTAKLRDLLRLSDTATTEVVDTLLEVAHEDMTEIWGDGVKAGQVFKAISWYSRIWDGQDSARASAAVVTP